MNNDANRKSPRLRIAIVGGGIGGLALATFLTANGVNDVAIDIYEFKASLTELGAGIGVWLCTWRILAAAGLAEGLSEIAPPGRDMSKGLRKAFEFRSADRSGREGRSFYTMEVPFGVLTLHRADFQQVLANRTIPPAVPHFNKAFVGYEYANENDLSSDIVLKFADGSIAHADVLIGADGIRSPTRGEMYHRLAARDELKDIRPVQASMTLPSTEEKPDAISDLIDPVFSGTNVYRCLIPLKELNKRFPGHRAGKGPVCYMGKDRHVIAFPIVHAAAKGEKAPMVNLVAFVSQPELEGTRISTFWVRPAPAVDLLTPFKGWEDEVQALLELVENPLLWAIHAIKPLPKYSDTDGRVVLIGDAAHAMTPHQGAGGGQAIEDAYVLAALLSDSRTTRRTLPAALRAYDAVRIPESQRVVAYSRLNGRMYEFNDGLEEPAGIDVSDQPGIANPHADEDMEMKKLKRLAENIMAIHEWEWAPLPAEGQPEKAKRLFEEALAKVGHPYISD